MDPVTPLPKAGAVLFAKDPGGVARFYRELLALQVTYADDGVIVLESSAQQLVIHAVPKSVAAAITITAPPRRRDNSAVKLVFPVESIAEARRKAPTLGGGIDPARKAFVARGFRACDGHDPEGNVIQLREPAPGSPQQAGAARED